MKTHVSNPTKNEIRQAKARVYSHLGNTYLVRRRKPRVDRRTRVGRLILNYYCELDGSQESVLITIKKMERAQARKGTAFTNILYNPLVRDYFANRDNLKEVHSSHLEFRGRNHWAKCERDLKILEILKRNWTKKLSA